jgi:hypothetical protein
MPTVATVPQWPIDLPRRSPALNQIGPRHVYPGGTVGQSAACIDADGICPLIIQWTMEGVDPPRRGARWGLGTLPKF